MRKLAVCAASVAAGALTMFFFDNQSGKRRRAEVGDRIASAGRTLRRSAKRQGKRAADQVQGTVHELRSAVSADGEPTSDTQLEARVRSALGRVADNPGAIDVQAHSGRVRLAGHIIAREHAKVLSTVAAMRGVESVEDGLAVYPEPGHVPELQGGAALNRR